MPPHHRVVVLVFSDGKSDPPPGYRRDIPFREIGEHTIQGKGFLIAVIGDKKFELSSINSDSPSSLTAPMKIKDSPLEELKNIVYSTIQPVLSTVELEASPSLFSVSGLSGKTEAEAKIAWRSESPLDKEVRIKGVMAELRGREIQVRSHSRTLLLAAQGQATMNLTLEFPALDPGDHHGSVLISFGPGVRPVKKRLQFRVRHHSWWQTWRLLIINISLGACIIILLLLGIWLHGRFKAVALSMNREQVQVLRRGQSMPIGGLSGFTLSNVSSSVGEIAYRGKGKFCFAPNGHPGVSVEIGGRPVKNRIPYVLGSGILVKGEGFEEVLHFHRASREEQRAQAGWKSFHGKLADDQDLLSEDLLQ